MPAYDEDRRSGTARDVPPQEEIETQRRRAALHSWVMLALTLMLLVIGPLYLPLGVASGQLQGDVGSAWIRNLRGPGFYLLWISLASWLFREFLRSLQRSRLLEDRQRRFSLLKRYSDTRTSAEEVIRLVEDGAPEQPTNGPAEKKAVRIVIQRKPGQSNSEKLLPKGPKVKELPIPSET